MASDGFEGLTLGSVARNLGMSHTAMSKRYDDIDDLLCDLWHHVAVPQIDATFSWVAHELERIHDPDRVVGQVPKKSLFRKSQEKLVMLELLALVPTRHELGRVVRNTFADRMKHVMSSDPDTAAQTVFLVALKIGIQAELRSTSAPQDELVTVVGTVIDAMARRGEHVVLPTVDSSHMRRYRFDTGDARVDRILTSCLENVGRRGLVDTTTKLIAHDAGVSEGLIFSLFDSKADIFFQATALQSKLGYKANLDFVSALNETYGPGIGNAILIREWLSPDLHDFRASLLEETRITWHDVDLWRRIQEVKRDLVGDERLAGSKKTLTPFERAVQFITFALPIGIYIIGEVLPDAVDLPFSIVTLSVF